MDIFQLFGHRNNQQQPQLRWDAFPNQVKLQALKLLDERSLRNIEIASTSARLILENTYGIHVTILPRSWINYVTAGILSVTSDDLAVRFSDFVLNPIYNLTKDKKIRSLELMEIPEVCSFDRLMHFPGHLKHVNIHGCGVPLLFDLFSKCPNLRTFQYRTGTMLLARLYAALRDKQVETGEWKWTCELNSNFLNNVHTCLSPIDPPTQLAHLKEVSLFFDETLDWCTLIFILLRLPVLPSVTRFRFDFQPEREVRVDWKYHLLVLSSLADFLRKRPNLEIFQYHSTYNAGSIFWDWMTLNGWENKVFSGLIERFGSDHLKEVEKAMMALARVPEVLIIVKNMMNAAAASLQNLQQLDLHLGESKEHDIFSGLISNLPSRLAKVSITDFSKSEDEPAPLRPNVYKVFTMARDRPQRLNFFDSITILSVNCTVAGIQRASVTKMLEAMPQVREMDFKGPDKPETCYLDLEDRTANPGIFERLEKLSIQNVGLAYEKFQGTGSRKLAVLCRFKNLKELNLQTKLINDGIDARDLLDVFNGLNKLNKVNVNPVLCNLQSAMALKCIGDVRKVNSFFFWNNGLIVNAYAYEFVM